jgi:protein-tyrosine phosphatase
MIHDTVTLKKQNVFIYDTCGISRAPTVVACYLALFKKVVCWSSLVKIEEHLKSCHPASFPNLRVVQLTINQNKEFQSHQYDYAYEKDHLIRLEQDKAETEKFAQLRILRE